LEGFCQLKLPLKFFHDFYVAVKVSVRELTKDLGLSYNTLNSRIKMGAQKAFQVMCSGKFFAR
jgi:hypothetical protein